MQIIIMERHFSYNLFDSFNILFNSFNLVYHTCSWKHNTTFYKPKLSNSRVVQQKLSKDEQKYLNYLSCSSGMGYHTFLWSWDTVLYDKVIMRDWYLHITMTLSWADRVLKYFEFCINYANYQYRNILIILLVTQP